jgi:uncharacterized alpha-E superfamily protein
LELADERTAEIDVRDTPLDFILLGSMLERAGQTARILDVQHHALELSQPHVVVDTALWLALLRACAGYEPFMRRHRRRRRAARPRAGRARVTVQPQRRS